MPLNYSKWDALELSDDSDIEGHPNVDHKSLVRMKQRQIHEQREMRKRKIAQLQLDISVHDTLRPQLEAIVQDVKTGGRATYSQTVDRLRAAGGKEDEMLVELLMKVSNESKAAGLEGDKLDSALLDGLQKNYDLLLERLDKDRNTLSEELSEQSKKITSDNLHEGWENKYVPPKPDPQPLPGAINVDAPTKQKKKATKTEFEIIHTPASSSSTTAAPPAVASTDGDADDEDEDEVLPQLTPSLLAFSEIPLGAYEKSWKFIQGHRDVVVEGATDALLVAAFDAQHAGQMEYAQQCVHQSLSLQYAEKLGRDGPRLFYQRMMASEPKARQVFMKDVADTYAHLAKRVAVAKEEASQGREQIQLVSENGEGGISFNVPDGPPPEDLRLEGPGTEDLDVEVVRKMFQTRWDIFCGFPQDLQDALKDGTLDAVNKVLGAMEVPEAENVVNMLQMSGILNVAEGVRDETGR